MIDKFLEVGAGFDWISPLLGFLGDALNGPAYTFLIPYDSCPVSGHEIGRILRKRGVRSWGRMIVSGTIMVSVRLQKARWAQQILEQAGVPLENPLPEMAGRPSRRSRRVVPGRGRSRVGSRQRREAGTLVDAVSEILNTPLF
jgi:hypothetical protein